MLKYSLWTALPGTRDTHSSEQSTSCPYYSHVLASSNIACDQYTTVLSVGTSPLKNVDFHVLGICVASKLPKVIFLAYDNVLIHQGLI